MPAGYGACPTCAFANPLGFAFCGGCGNKLALGVAPPVEDVGSAQTVFVEQAPEEFRQLRDQARGAGLVDAAPPVVAPPVVAPPAQAAIGPAARLIMLGPDGSPIGERVVAPGETLPIGRAAGPPWDEDAYLDNRHGSLTPLAEGIRAEDYGSLNGIYVKLSGRMEIQSGDQFRVGQELLLYEDLPEPTPTEDGTERMGSPNPGYWGRLSLLVEPTVASQAYAIEGEGIAIGRETGDITFPHDGYVSGAHCRIVGDDTGVYVEDLGSSNGTYMRVRSGALLPYGSLVLIGQKLFQLEQA
jgi:FHA domain